MTNYEIRNLIVSIVTISLLFIFAILRKKGKHKEKKIVLILAICISITYYFLNIFVFEGTFKKFNSVEEAVLYGHPECEIIKKFEKGDYAMIIFQHGSTIESKPFYKEESGWKAIDSNGYLQYVKTVNGYTIWRYKYKDKNLIYINVFNINGENAVPPTDNINSNFEYFLDTQEHFPMSHWFLLLDELPESYEITVDKTVIIPKTRVPLKCIGTGITILIIGMCILYIGKTRKKIRHGDG